MRRCGARRRRVPTLELWCLRHAGARRGARGAGPALLLGAGQLLPRRRLGHALPLRPGPGRGARLRLQPHAPRLQPHAPRLQPHAPRLQPHAPRLQPHSPRRAAGVPRPRWSLWGRRASSSSGEWTTRRCAPPSQCATATCCTCTRTARSSGSTPWCVSSRAAAGARGAARRPEASRWPPPRGCPSSSSGAGRPRRRRRWPSRRPRTRTRCANCAQLPHAAAGRPLARRARACCAAAAAARRAAAVKPSRSRGRARRGGRPAPTRAFPSSPPRCSRSRRRSAPRRRREI